MKSIVFTEEQLKNLSEIGNELFNDPQDPRSAGYVRVLNRPKINWIRVVLFILIPVLTVIAIVAVMKYFGLPTPAAVIVSSVSVLLYIIFTLKRAIICTIKIYQRYAPDSVRNKCRFEPSCSEYMILAIEKYGLCKGVRKGINRLKRCNVNGGGFDYP